MMGIKEELHAKLARLAGSTPEMYERLCIEIKEADDSEILNMFAKTSKLISQLNEKGLHAELSPAMGYPFSFLCYLMDITDMNPFDYPEIETLDIVLKTFRTHKYIVIFTDKGGKAAAEDMLLQEKTAFRIIIKENLECNRRTRILAADFFKIRYRYGSTVVHFYKGTTIKPHFANIRKTVYFFLERMSFQEKGYEHFNQLFIRIILLGKVVFGYPFFNL